MSKYPKVNYIGNKEKLVHWIAEELPITHGKVLDIFAGGCSVSYALKQRGFEVITNDILYSDYVLAKAIIENTKDRLDPVIFEKKVKLEKIEEKYEELSFLSECLYYKQEVEELARLVCIGNMLKGNEKYLYLALLRRSMIRKLPYSRMNVPWNQIERLRDEEYSYQKYGRKRAYHNKGFETHMRDNLQAYNEAVFDNGKVCKVFHCDAQDIAKKIDYVDVVYMDPPYPSTMNNYDSFYGMFDEMFGKGKAHIDYTHKTTFLKRIENLIRSLIGKTRFIVMSQNDRVQPGVNEVLTLLEKYGQVEIKEKQHNYQVTGKDNKNGGKELLFILQLRE